MDEWMFEGIVISVAQKGVVNSSIFIKWLVHFENSVSTIVKRPLVLIYYGNSSHYNNDFLDKSIEIYIILVLLSDNATHLTQPLGITLFTPFKNIFRQKMETIHD